MRLVLGTAKAVALIALFALASCGGEPGQGRDDYLPGSPRGGTGGALSQVPDASCSQWRRGNPTQRQRVIEQIHAFFERRTRGGGGHTLPEDKARDSIEQACGQSYAREWKLWKIYERALAFQYPKRN